MLAWGDYDSTFAWCEANYNNAVSAAGYIGTYYDLALDALNDNDVKLAVQALIATRNYLVNGIKYAASYRFFYEPEYGILALFNIVHAEGNGAEVTMSAVLSALLVADPDEVKQFVGITDAFKQSIWDKPYNREFYAALGRGFMEWP